MRFEFTDADLAISASRYHISARELQVMMLLMDGMTLAQISAKLCIASSTVQDHIRSMMERTDSKNRSEMIARLLGWNSKYYRGKDFETERLTSRSRLCTIRK